MSSAFDRTVRLLNTVNEMPASTPPSSTNSTPGYTIAQIHARHNVLYPLLTLTLSEVTDLIHAGTGAGVFSPFVVPSGVDVGEFHYLMNPQMVRLNPANQKYYDLVYVADPDQPRPGYLPCSCKSGSAGPLDNPYGQSSSSSFSYSGR